MRTSLSRRQFLKAGVAGGLSLTSGALLDHASPVVLARPKLAERVMQSIAQPSFTPLPSKLPLGSSLADISMGWDGSVWGIDKQGVPHQYDLVQQKWQVYGSGFDAVGKVADPDDPDGPGLYIVARGTEVSINGKPAQPLARVWDGLPDSFAAGLDGIATAQNSLFLFRHGRFITIKPSDDPGVFLSPMAFPWR